MTIRLLPIVAIISLLLTGCSETSSEVGKDGDEQRRDAVESNDQERSDTTREVAKANETMSRAQQSLSNRENDKILTEVESEAMIAKAESDYDIAMMEANGRHLILKEKCDDLEKNANDTCVGEIDDALTADRSLATDNRDTAIVAVQYRK